MGSRAKKSRVGKKIGHMMDEGMPHKQAVAVAMNMERKGRITESGGYRHVKKRSK